MNTVPARWLRQHSNLLALLSVLAAAIAAPYLVPIDPNSAVFRSGAFGALLLLACFFPVRDSFERSDLRTLLCAMVFALLFAIALSLGSELRVYQSLLPGTGSLVRRLAVPVLVTPLLGGLCARVMHVRLPREHHAVPGIVFMLIFLLAWLPVLLAYFPAAMNYDIPSQVSQCIKRNYNNQHPMLHTLFIASMLRIGRVLGQGRTFGLLLMSVTQMALFAGALAYACVFVQKRGAPRWILIVMTLIFSLHPIFSVMSVSTTKDTLFSCTVLVFTLQSIEMIEEGAAFFARKRSVCLYVIMMVCCVLLRNNGVAALILTLPALFILCKGARKQIVLMSLMGIILVVCFSAVINVRFHPRDVARREAMSLPAQQLIRAHYCGTLTQEDKDEIKSWYVRDVRLLPYSADNAKFATNRTLLEENPKGFFSFWARIGLQCPREYLEAFLMQNIGSWYVDDLTHSTIYRDQSNHDMGYLQTQEFDLSDFGLYTQCYLPAVRNHFEQICRRNVYQKYPLISLLFNTALPLWAIIAAGIQLCARRRSRLLAALLCPIGYWGSLLVFSPCTLPRYILPLFCLALPLLTVAFLPAPDSEASSA